MQLEGAQVAVGRHPPRLPVGQRRRPRARSAPRGSCCAARPPAPPATRRHAACRCRLERVAGALGQRHRVEALAPVEHGAEQPLARGHERRDAGLREEPVELPRPGRSPSSSLEKTSTAALGAHAERAQPHAQLLLRQPSGERLGQHVAGQAPLGVAHRALAHQLERHDGHRLLEDQPLEVAEPAGVERREQPGLRRAAAASGHREHQRAAGDLRMVGGELAGSAGRSPRPAHLLAHLLHGAAGERAPELAPRRSSPRGRRARTPRRRWRRRARAPPRRGPSPPAPGARAACGSLSRAGARRTARSRAW